jgi:hypothetical protein
MHRTLAIILQVERRFVVIERRLDRRMPTEQFRLRRFEVFCQLGNVACWYLGLAGLPALIGRLGTPAALAASVWVLALFTRECFSRLVI